MDVTLTLPLSIWLYFKTADQPTDTPGDADLVATHKACPTLLTGCVGGWLLSPALRLGTRRTSKLHTGDWGREYELFRRNRICVATPPSKGPGEAFMSLAPRFA